VTERASDESPAETELPAGHDLERLLFDHVRDVVVVTGPDWTLLDANRSAHQVLGYHESDLVGRAVLSLVAADFRERTRVWLARAFGGEGDLGPEESELLTQDGKSVPIELSSTPVIRDGQVAACLCICRDLTSQRRMEAALQALRASEAMLADAQRVAHLGSCDYDVATGTLTWSDELYRIYGLDPDRFELTWDEILAHVHPEDRRLAQESVRTALETGQPFEIVHRIVRPDGSVRVTESRGTVISDAEGRPLRMTGTARDITEEHESDEERRLLRAELVHAHKLEAIGILAGGVAHDFNNALTAIRGYAELVLTELDPTTPAWGDATALRRVAEHAASLPRQLLAFARRQTLQPRELDLGAVVGEAEGLLDHVLGQCTLTVERARATARVRCDPGQLQLVLVNLALNARDAMPDGGVFTVKTGAVELAEDDARARHLTPGSYASLVASDTGRGMDAETRDRALEPFFSTKEAGKGTGLGLATVYGIVTQSGGTVTIESEPGRGATVEILLPALTEPPVGGVPGTAGGREGAGSTVLLVEDEPVVLGVLQRALRRAGYEVLSATSAADALEQLDAEAGIDVLVTDVRLPGADGTELARAVQERIPAVVVLYVSGYTDEVLDPGDARFLAKPFSPTELVAAVESALAGSGARR
jgi:PAS domain S-box-containing protein